jgi:hypothetical protein
MAAVASYVAIPSIHYAKFAVGHLESRPNRPISMLDELKTLVLLWQLLNRGHETHRPLSAIGTLSSANFR